ncbi:hypothetical protein [Halovivax limisalsi]|uniref:hypothetical protein n=1 Tax=Halovivax limisalsi TaxID=1453760 RepID=UPI001FFDB1F8|nr:hypothetical protein [Halovivax limisalsi]
MNDLTRRSVITVALVTTAGCIDGDSAVSDEPGDESGTSDEDPTKGENETVNGDGDPSEGPSTYMDLVFYLVDPNTADDGACYSIDDDHFAGVKLFEEGFDDLRSNPPSTWVEGAEPGTERIGGTVGADTPAGSEAATVYRSVFEDTAGVSDGVPDSYLREAAAASDASLSSETVPCVEYDGNVIALLLRIEQEN